MNRRFASSERAASWRLVQRIKRHIEHPRQEELAREIVADASRDELWAETAQREGSLAREVQSTECRVPRIAAAKDCETVLVAHSTGAGEMLEKLADDGARLMGVISDGASAVGKSWLVFEPQRRSQLWQRVGDYDTG